MGPILDGFVLGWEFPPILLAWADQAVSGEGPAQILGQATDVVSPERLAGEELAVPTGATPDKASASRYGINLIVPLAGVIFLSVSAQWLAWRLRIPSILLLLSFGILAGPVAGAVLPAVFLPPPGAVGQAPGDPPVSETPPGEVIAERPGGPDLVASPDAPTVAPELGLIRPRELLGEALLPFVSLAVALILFEGGLTLRFAEIKPIGWAFFRMGTIGSAITWALASLSYYGVFLAWGIPVKPAVAILLGAILIVTGPTVIGPLLRHVRPNRRVGNLLKWESIVIDPVGAILAVFVFEFAVAATNFDGASHLAFSIVKTIVMGGGLGTLGAGAVILALRKYAVPDNLHNPFVLMLVVSIHAVCEFLQPDAGLVAVTVMGVILANQRTVSLQHVIEFKESLRDLLIGVLFILLSSRLALADLTQIAVPGLIMLGLLVLVVRPVSIALALMGTGMPVQEKAFLAWMAPRGVVAAAVASTFALELAEKGEATGRTLAPVMFVIIIGTVAVYGLTAGPIARWLGLTVTHQRGVLIVGAQVWARELATVLAENDCPVQIVDTNRANVNAARMAGLPVYFGSILSEHARESVDLSEMSQMLALTRNDEVNSLACLRFIEVFGRQRVYQLPFGLSGTGRKETVSTDQRGRFLFEPTMTFTRISEIVEAGGRIKATRLTEAFSYDEYLQRSGPLTPLAFVSDKGVLTILTAETPHRRPQSGDLIISLLHTPRDARGKRGKTESGSTEPTSDSHVPIATDD